MRGRIIFILFSLVSSAACAQSTEIPVIHSDSVLVAAPATVRRSTGDYLQKLNASQFQILDNEIPQKASVDKTAHDPIALTVLLQTGSSGSSYFSSYARLPELLQKLTGESVHELMLVTFDSRTEQIWHFPTHTTGLSSAMTHPNAGDEGAAILDGLNDALNQMQAEPGHFRRIVLLISQARDSGSEVIPEEFLHNLAKSNATIYCLTFPGQKKPGFRSKQSLPENRKSAGIQARTTGQTSRPLDRATVSLHRDTAQAIAALSGGRLFKFHNEEELSRQIAAIADDIANRYLLTFRPSSTTPGLHLLEVRVTPPEKHLQIFARSLYWREDHQQ
jgi:VWFA-related protein